ncbi:MAG: TetR/AcrR family transcriptional regulator [Clostridia bacterium]|nr:TetR/AcrR family transcriptional regulator [Clostridia bacterium]
MPPKAKFTKEEIIKAAVDLVRQRGIEAVTARELGAQLGSSARPVFTVFKNMDEVLSEVGRSAREPYNDYVAEGLKQEKAFKGVGMAYIRFAIEEPNLFRFLFMGEHDAGVQKILPEIDDNYSAILSSITDDYGMTPQQAERFYRHLWTYSHGIATLCATGSCKFTMQEVSGLLNEAGRAFIILLRSEKQ